MQFHTFLAAALLMLGGGAASAQALLIHNARGVTLDERGHVVRFDAMSVGMDGRVLAIGKLSDLQAKA
ncbi:MAG TPA: hypothetical protein VN201_08065, partial [Roseateles sp.]|nr:hypothetical protein [Roseateles sp.]